MEVPPDVVARFGLVEPIADIPALRGHHETRGLHGFHTGQGSSPTAEQIVDNPVHRRGFDEGLQGFPQDRVQQRVRSRLFTFQSRTVASMTFILLLQRIFQIRRVRRIKGFVALLTGTQNVRRFRALSSARVLRESSSWPP